MWGHIMLIQSYLGCVWMFLQWHHKEPVGDKSVDPHGHTHTHHETIPHITVDKATVILLIWADIPSCCN